ncbi:MAG: Cobalt-precorrin-8 methylmutase [Chroococcopsis gigantea SAG 12.99]|jgi:precorrin-8X/cobalt-precorrin-8 methylmutase|nr:precorrin-8X methylmutase [Chlorogloea purpurea SAG 13.99]MDV2999738.1 Cobalt-precorrin-8 methylmutase [Chroococcopsis gigantea SAG 12.99]
MELPVIQAQNLALIDQEIETNRLGAAQLEILRRIIYETGDFEYQFLLRFSEKALASGAAALAARSTIIVDVPMVQAGIINELQKTFANAVYCGTETITRPQKGKTKAEWGIQTLASRYPEAIFVVGQSQSALHGLVELIEEKDINPALIIGTPATFMDADVLKERLKDTEVPYITIDGTKGGAVAAVAIVNGLVSLAWQAYGQHINY